LSDERIPTGRRREKHRAIEERLEVGYGEQAKKIAAELAVHFEQEQEHVKAVQYLAQVGETPLLRGAHQEAVSSTRRGLRLLRRLPPSSERNQSELGLQATLGTTLMATQGYAARDVQVSTTRALALCKEVRETQRVTPVVFALFGYYLAQAEYKTAGRLAPLLFRMVQDLEDSSMLSQGYWLLGTLPSYEGGLTMAKEYLNQRLSLYDQQRSSPYAVKVMEDAGANCLSYLAFTLFHLGCVDKAMQRTLDAVDLPRS
jgi:predicted ATPase